MAFIEYALTIKNVIFDLGGVIIDLSVERTVHALADLAGKSPAEIYAAYHAHPEFMAYEKGQLTDAQFRTALQQIFNFKASDSSIDRCWNAMLVDLPKGKLDLLTTLKDQFSVAVLSNTNAIHLRYVDEIMLPPVSDFDSLNHYFHLHYYSHHMGKRKPDVEIFEQVLDESHFIPGQTLFLDDNPDNIAAALTLGIRAQQIKHPDDVYELFNTL